MKLSAEQKMELKEWQENNPDSRQSKKSKATHNDKSAKKKLHETVSQLVAKALNKAVKEASEVTTSAASEEKSTEAAISAMIEAAVKKKLSAVTTSSAMAKLVGQLVALNSILQSCEECRFETDQFRCEAHSL